MPDPRQTLGQRGENFVAYRLTQDGYTILARNWRRGASGELDVIARRGTDEIVFVEVRTRRGPLQAAVDAALASVNARKKDKLIRLAQAFLTINQLDRVAWRIDVAAVGYANGQFVMEIIHDAAAW